MLLNGHIYRASPSGFVPRLASIYAVPPKRVQQAEKQTGSLVAELDARREEKYLQNIQIHTQGIGTKVLGDNGRGRAGWAGARLRVSWASTTTTSEVLSERNACRNNS